jgi:hypothetical protein
MDDPDLDEATPESFLGRIYRISAPTCDKVYVGSTRTTLATRLGRHRRDMRGYKRGTYHYVSSFDVLEHPGATIDLLEEAEYHDVQQFREREAYWITRHASCNRVMPGRDRQTSNKISKAAEVLCGTCGVTVRRGVVDSHRLTRACMTAAFKKSSGSSGERKNQPWTSQSSNSQSL